MNKPKPIYVDAETHRDLKRYVLDCEDAGRSTTLHAEATRAIKSHIHQQRGKLLKLTA